MNIHYCYTDSPLGELMLAGDANGLRILAFQDGPEPMFPERGWRKDAAYFVNAIVQLNEYFAGQRTRFALRLNPEATEFQLRVLETLARIPYGQTASYADIARLLKKPRAVRAVGAANRKNPLPIMLPCHRVIGSDGSLTGFIGGLERKKWLINLEAETLQARGSRSEKSQQADQAVPA